jgi:2-polyprenyl-6-hydroxyphenyl methylase/3-demethylubiquinone-9 3-methyltransferase
MTVHPVAASGFGSGAAAYERGRPSYPSTVVDLLVEELGIGLGTRVVDLGAGTGKWTRLLVERGARVYAVEPVGGMRDELLVAVPEAEPLEAPAEAVPLPDGSIDVVTAAQSFHWFDAPAALAECARLLRPGGTLVLDALADTALSRFVMVRLLEHVPGGPPPGLHDPALFVDRTRLLAAADRLGLELRLVGLRPSLREAIAWRLGRREGVRMLPMRSTAVVFAGYGRKR